MRQQFESSHLQVATDVWPFQVGKELKGRAWEKKSSKRGSIFCQFLGEGERNWEKVGWPHKSARKTSSRVEKVQRKGCGYQAEVRAGGVGRPKVRKAAKGNRA